MAARRSQRAELMTTPRAGGVAANLEGGGGGISEGSYMPAHISYEKVKDLILSYFDGAQRHAG